MQIGRCSIRKNPYSCSPRLNITPAEVIFLRESFAIESGTEPIVSLQLIGSANRSKKDELARLRSMYRDVLDPQNNKVRLLDRLFPTAEAIPIDFEGPIPVAPVEERGPMNWTPDEVVSVSDIEPMQEVVEEEMILSGDEEGKPKRKR